MFQVMMTMMRGKGQSETTNTPMKKKKKKKMEMMMRVICSNEPTQQGALPLRNERRGTLTARP